MSSLPTYAPGPGVRPEALGMPKRLLVPNEEVCWVDFRLGKGASVDLAWISLWRSVPASAFPSLMSAVGRSAHRPCIWTQYMPGGGRVVSSPCPEVCGASPLAIGLALAAWALPVLRTVASTAAPVEPTHDPLAGYRMRKIADEPSIDKN